jgi:translation initiation factor 2 alpha subunit (eIF-2alpha)
VEENVKNIRKMIKKGQRKINKVKMNGNPENKQVPERFSGTYGKLLEKVKNYEKGQIMMKTAEIDAKGAISGFFQENRG